MENRRTTTPADIVTYRLNDKMVYVTPADSYEQAIDFAKKVFPDELRKVNRNNISFSITVITRGDKKRSVWIADMAWSTVVSTLHRYEIIDVHVQPEVQVTHDDITSLPPPPMYTSDSKEAAEFYAARARSCPPSPHLLTRQVSPSPSLGSNNKKGTGARGWWEKHFS
jgi:hypothetical protein